MTTARKIILLFALGGTLSCSHKSTPYDAPTPDYLLSKGSQQLTFLGDNERPRFSENNKKLLYFSRNRNAHKTAQVYELDLTSNKERRVTFSDGDAFDPIYISEDEILYASTTDEIKERPLENKVIDKKSPPSDLYMSDLYGSDIVRLSFQPGFDAEPIFVPNQAHPFILFTSKRDDYSGIYRLDLKNLPVSTLSGGVSKNRASPTLSPDLTQLAWIESDPKSKEQSLVLFDFKTKITRTLKKGDGSYRDLIWAPRPPQRLFYSIQRSGEKHYQIEYFQLENNCTQIVFKGNDHLIYPVVSNEPSEKLAFVRNFQEKSQIYMVPFPTDLGPCLSPPAQANLNP